MRYPSILIAELALSRLYAAPLAAYYSQKENATGTKRTEEFRQEAVRIAQTSGLTRMQVASDLNVGFSTLCKWIQQDRKNVEKPLVQSDLEREVSELKKENRLLCEERDILKKATVFLRAKIQEVPVR